MTTNILVIDIGNTLTKFALMNDNGLINQQVYTINSKPVLDYASLIEVKNKFLYNLNFEYIIISSVVPNNNPILEKFLSTEINKKYLFINEKLNTVVKFTAKEVGADIIAKSAYLAFKKQEGIILDLGTATVINYINKYGVLEKIAITAGFKAMYEAINNSTSQIPLYTPQKMLTMFHDTTEKAIHGGTYIGYLGLINNLIKEAIKETKCKNIYFTGGYSFLFKNDVNFKSVYDKELLYKGAYIIYKANQSLFIQ
ncbi:type III pantothenate kinase [Rickettsiales bacterium LUAb2]